MSPKSPPAPLENLLRLGTKKLSVPTYDPNLTSFQELAVLSRYNAQWYSTYNHEGA